MQIIAHRGASHEAPENTIKAFDRAYHLQADFIELDVHLSKDNIPIVIHDLKYVLEKEKHLDSLLAMLKGEKIPTLEEILKKNYPEMGYMIEIKEGSASEDLLVEKVVEQIQMHPIFSYCIGSISLKILEKLQTYHPKLPIIAIIDNKKNIDQILQLGINHLAIHFSFIDQNIMKTFRKQNVKVWVWTVDHPTIVRKMTQLNIDGIITNNPQKIKAYLY